MVINIIMIFYKINVKIIIIDFIRSIRNENNN